MGFIQDMGLDRKGPDSHDDEEPRGSFDDGRVGGGGASSHSASDKDY